MYFIYCREVDDCLQGVKGNGYKEENFVSPESNGTIKVCIEKFQHSEHYCLTCTHFELRLGYSRNPDIDKTS